MRPEAPALQVNRCALETGNDASDDSYDMVGYESAQPGLAQMVLAQTALSFDADLAPD